jgi:transposase
MIALSAEVRIHLATGATDLRKGFDGLAALVQQVLNKDPFGGHLFVFRGRRADSDGSRPPVPTRSRPAFRFDVGHHSGMKPASR